MKKIFLSFAALALVAVGTVSCGGDDSSPVKPTTDNPGNTDTPNPQTDTPNPSSPGKFTYDGSDYALDNMGFTVHRVGTSGSVTFLNIADEGQPAEYVTLWQGVLFDGDDIMTAPHYYQYQFFVPAKVEGESLSLLLPNEVDEIIPRNIYAELELQPLELTVNAGAITFNTFVLGENEGDVSSSNNASQFLNNSTVVISHQFNGDLLGVGIANLLPQQKGSEKYRMLPTTELMSLKDLKKATGKVSISEAKSFRK